jgi:hypothetical protein
VAAIWLRAGRTRCLEEQAGHRPPEDGLIGWTPPTSYAWFDRSANPGVPGKRPVTFFFHSLFVQLRNNNTAEASGAQMVRTEIYGYPQREMRSILAVGISSQATVPHRCQRSQTVSSSRAPSHPAVTSCSATPNLTRANPCHLHRMHQGGPSTAVAKLTASAPLPVQQNTQTAFTRLVAHLPRSDASCISS